MHQQFIPAVYRYPDPKTPTFDPAGLSASQRFAVKVYLVTYTNKTQELDGNFKISYF